MTNTPDLTSQDQINKSIGMCRLHGLHNTEATLRALSAERDALKAERDERANTASKLDSAATRYLTRAEAAETERDALKAELAEAVDALQMFVYETTHLSPIEDDGSHWCKISADCLETARAFLARHQKETGV